MGIKWHAMPLFLFLWHFSSKIHKNLHFWLKNVNFDEISIEMIQDLNLLTYMSKLVNKHHFAHGWVSTAASWPRLLQMHWVNNSSFLFFTTEGSKRVLNW
ncbi:MAG: hypothetical protein JWR23_2728 [Mucilaginibacter sp.]|nr:hypothetical protein [Mucilaginibacter sp.]